MASCAANAAWLIIAETVDPMGTICAGLLKPISRGPMTVLRPISLRSFAEIFALCRAGMIKTLAGSESLQKG